VPRPDLQVVGQGLEALHAVELRACAHFLGAHVPRCLLKKVGPANISHKDEVAGKDAHGALRVEPHVLPVGVAFVGDVDARALLGELAQAREVVGVDVGVRRRDDAQAILRSELLVAVDVALGVDDDRLACLLASDQVGGFSELLVVDLAKEHGHPFSER